jgi:hypothetical protein
MATLWQLRQGLLEEYGAGSPAVIMVIDLAVISYHNALRIQGWIGDLGLVIEHELFGEESLQIKLGGLYGPQFNGFAVVYCTLFVKLPRTEYRGFSGVPVRMA